MTIKSSYVCVFVCVLSLVTAWDFSRKPLGSPFVFYGSKAFVAKGSFYSHINVPASYGIPDSRGPAEMITVPSQKSYFVNLTQTAGIQWTLPNGTYYILGGKCYFDSTYGTFDKMNATYVQQAVKTGELLLFDLYDGLVNDMGACGLGVSFSARVGAFDSRLYRTTFAQWAPSPVAGFYFTATGSIDFNHWEDADDAVIPPLPQVCWSLDVTQKSSQWCDSFNFPKYSFVPPPPPTPPPVPVSSGNDSNCQIQMEKVARLYQSIIFPTPTAIVQNTSLVADLFDPAVKTRISPLGEFPGFQGTLEYFYGLASFFTAQVQSVNIKTMTCTGNMVASATDLLFYTLDTDLPNYPYYNLTQFAFFSFDPDTHLITAIDADILNLGAAEDVPDTIDPATNRSRRLEAIGFVCTLTVYGAAAAGIPQSLVPFNASVGTCQGKNTIWNNSLGLSEFDYCMAIMTGQIPNPTTGVPMPFGTYYRSNSNTVACRTIHALLTPYAPDVHCPHVSPGGGMTCVDMPYTVYYAHGKYDAFIQQN